MARKRRKRGPIAKACKAHGRKGGKRCLLLHGLDYYVDIGHLGGIATAERYIRISGRRLKERPGWVADLLAAGREAAEEQESEGAHRG